MNNFHIQIAGAYVVATAALLHSCWSRNDHEARLSVESEASSLVILRANKAKDFAEDAKSRADDAMSEASKAKRSADDAVKDGDRVKIRDCEDWLGDRRCKLVK